MVKEIGTSEIAIDHAAVLAMSRQDAVRYYMETAGATEDEALYLVSSTHPSFKDVVHPAPAKPERVQERKRLGQFGFGKKAPHPSR